MENQTLQRKGRRLVFFPVPFQGHINPMLQLANILHSQGFTISIIHTHFNSPNPSNYPHFTFHPIPYGLSPTKDSTVDMADVVVLIKFFNKNGAKPLRDCLVGLLSEAETEAEPIACLITDAHWHFSQAVANGLKLPRIVLRTSSVASFLAFAAYPLLRQKGYFLVPDSQSEAPVPEFPPLKVKDIPKIFIGNPEAIHNDILSSMMQGTKASSGLIWNSFAELEQPELMTLNQDFPIPTFPIGPFHKYFPASSSSLLAQDRTSISWLDSQAPESVIYVSFGSMVEMDESEFIEMAWGLANSKQPFLWVVRPGLIHGSERLESSLPNGFWEAVGERGHVIKWAPQQEVLAHPAIGGFWTHNGWNSTLESICEGVPMICSPFLGDQLVNARYVSDIWKIGVKLENGLERGEIERAIKRLMVDIEGKVMREKIMCMKEKINLCLKQCGSSYQSLESLVNYILSF